MLKHSRNSQTYAMTSTMIGVAFMLGALAHAMGWLQVSSSAEEARILPAAVTELCCGILMLVAAMTLRAHRPGAWRNAIIAHVLAFAAIVTELLGLLLGLRDTTQASALYQGVMAAFLLFNLIGLWRTRPRNPIKRAQHRIASRLY
jgi:hypothetical protein